MALGRLHKYFKSLGLIEKFQSISDEKPPVSFVEGSKQLDAVQVSPSLCLKAVRITPFLFGIGNHRVIIINFNADLILRSIFILICPIQMRRLTSKQEKIVENYLWRAGILRIHYKIPVKLDRLKLQQNNIEEEERDIKLNKLNLIVTKLL